MPAGIGGGGWPLARQSSRAADSSRTAMPSHLCQLKKRKRCGENGRSTIDRPIRNAATISAASSQ